ncbi:MAG: hypothetical protein GY812_17350 [Actinomycetia bacterium]|nr:hypothetical protein [Actinomycetes bacterium]
MQQLQPSGESFETPASMLEMLDSDRPEPPEGRPSVSTNMVMSLDGAYSLDGTSGGLSSPTDHALFIAQRSLADYIIVGASTVRAEMYRRPSVTDEAARIRALRGQDPVPRIVITSRSLELPDDVPLLHGDPPAPIMAHPASSDPDNAPQGVELLTAGESGVDFELLLEMLGQRGARHVVCEGGPGVLGQLAGADLIDEYLLTLSPHLVGGDRVGLLSHAQGPESPYELHRTMRDGDYLMLSYRRAAGT